MAHSFADAQSLLLNERGRELLVINPGSENLRLGFASSDAPLEVKHVAAYARRGAPPPPRPRPDARDAWDEECEAACRQLEDQLQLPASTLPAGLAAAEEAAEVEEAWTDVSGGPRALFGESALRLAPKDQPGYAPVWPMRGGRLDVRADQPLSVVRSAVEDVWRWAVFQALGCSRETVRQSGCVLVYPSTLEARELKELAVVLLQRLGFASLVLHAEATAVCCACATPLACVVSLGAHCTSVACVEDGCEVPATRLQLPTGARDLARALPRLAQRQPGHPAWPGGRPPGPHALERLLHGHTAAPSAQQPLAAMPAHPMLGSACYLTPLAHFAPRLLGLRCAVRARAARCPLPPDPEDTLDEAYLAEVAGAAVRPQQARAEAEDSLGLDEAVLHSILQLASARPDVRQRLLASVLLVGGGARQRGLAEALSERLLQRLPAPAEQEPPAAAMATAARPDPRFAAWRGGALLAAVDGTRDGWVRREALTQGVLVGQPGRYDAAATVLSQLTTYVT